MTNCHAWIPLPRQRIPHRQPTNSRRRRSWPPHHRASHRSMPFWRACKLPFGRRGGGPRDAGSRSGRDRRGSQHERGRQLARLTPNRSTRQVSPSINTIESFTSMAFPTAVNSQITDAVTQTNVKVLGDAPPWRWAICIRPPRRHWPMRLTTPPPHSSRATCWRRPCSPAAWHCSSATPQTGADDGFPHRSQRPDH